MCSFNHLVDEVTVEPLSYSNTLEYEYVIHLFQNHVITTLNLGYCCFIYCMCMLYFKVE